MDSCNLKLCLNPGEFATFLGLIGAALAFGIGFFQYLRSQVWKKTEFAAKHLETFYQDPAIQFCRQVLDYKSRQIPVPASHRALFTSDIFEHTDEKLKAALRDTDWVDCKNADTLLYRDCFDRLFDFLESTNHFLELKLFRLEDVEGLEYWINELSKPRFTSDKKLFLNFLAAYGYNGALELVRTFNDTKPQRQFRATLTPKH